MRNQIIALKNKSDGAVAVIIPVCVSVLPGRYAVDDKIAARIAVQSADDVEHGRFSRTAGAEYGNEFAFPKGDADAF